MIRNIVTIDEENCDGCGLCVPACDEGAIQIIDGKAKLVSEVYCDGLGACLGECPNDAITIEEREAEEFDEKAVEHHLAHLEERAHEEVPAHGESESLPCGCPGSAVQEISRGDKASPVENVAAAEDIPSQLSNWPVQMHLVPVNAPYLQGADVLLAADCTPFALADFHRKLLKDRILLVGCPKLDDAEFYSRKLTEILKQNDTKSLTVVYMEVPCCFGLVALARKALEDSGVDIPFTIIKVGIRGDILEEEEEVSRLSV
jgi:Pyruvate/2-oxoacid:ferredoxin oxidoreductase delta subunit